MSPEPQVQPLPYHHRTWFFRSLLLVFVCLVPIFFFYATGYRVSFTETDRNIVSVGGLFVAAETEDTAIYLNDELVENYRLFQRAAYIQNLPSSIHRLHVQGEGLHTWVKELPVYPHIGTEAQAFNFPVSPQVRLITPYETATGRQFVAAASGTLPLGADVTYRVPYQASTTQATSTLRVNDEYAFVADLFATSSTTTPPTLRTRIQEQLEGTFTFSTVPATSTATSSTATTTRQQNDRRLFETDEGLFVSWEGDPNNHPYYFCINVATEVSSSTALGVYVANNVANLASAVETAATRGDFVCRSAIKMDTLDRPVYLFDFFPGSDDLVLAQLSDGLYAIEVDDRGWQNTQLLYPGEDITVALFGQQIFVRDRGYYFELLTTLAN